MRRLWIVLLVLVAAIWLFMPGDVAGVLPPAELEGEVRLPHAASGEVVAVPRSELQSAGNRQAARPAGMLATRGSLCIRCVNHEGAPVAAVPVDISESTGYLGEPRALGAFVAGEDGCIWISPSAVTREVAVTSRDSDWMSDGRWLVHVDRPVVVVTFARADVALHGVVRSRDGLPLSRVKVSCRGRSALSDKDGVYRIRVARKWSRHLIAELSGYVPSRAALAVGLVDDAVHDFALTPAPMVRGVVSDEDGQPLLGCTVTAGTRYGWTVTDASGAFVSPCNPADPSLVVAHRDYPRHQHNISPQDLLARDVRITMKRGRVLRGVVRSMAGQAIAGATVAVESGVSWRCCKTDLHGQFLATRVPLGRAQLTVAASGYVAKEFAFHHGEGAGDADCVLVEGATFYGVVVDDDGKAVVGAQIYVLRDSEYGRALPGLYRGGAVVKYDGRGAFRIADMPAFVAVEVVASGYQRQLHCDLAVQGSPHTLRIGIAGEIRGHVRDGVSGAPITRFTVLMVDGDLLSGETPVVGTRTAWRASGVAFSSPQGLWHTQGEELVPGAVVGLEIRAEGYQPLLVSRAQVQPMSRGEIVDFTLRPL